ncbi:histidinol-phosphate transaminase [Oleiagrimonas sp. C23AA]|uniref:histidinol-phosphate transaminase n=1 Tax=Oleiagrimonas sp. C23AA TaxID=2719047 RepID=UPI00141F85B5|nr:histidinol-phosphate transaminase [Oleiagrimonas sp. C23AA]NII10333.1 histidinol-phosphate transaminase [Oleiagrimonas sp. C23AA]
MSIIDRARPQVRALTPYSSARMEAGDAAIMLNANESPWAPPGDAGRQLNRYPQPQPQVLRERLAMLYGVEPTELLIGRGSDEAIDLLVRAFCTPGVDGIAICPPTFGMYAVCAATQDAAITQVPLRDDFSVDVEALLSTLPETTKLVFLCSPNNPTGGCMPRADIERIAGALSERAMVIVDEAYIEFAEAESAATLIARYPNLGVLRTLSKAWALAGARVGVLLADAPVIALLRKIMAPYPLPTPCVEAALVATDADGEALTRERIATVRAERRRLADALRQLPQVLDVYPSDANFLTVRLADAKASYQQLAAQGVVVRDVGRYPLLAGCLRFSIGTPQENNRLLAILAEAATGLEERTA